MGHFRLIRLGSQRSGRPSFTERGLSSRSEDIELTPRELEVEDLLCRGYSQENIAAIFGRSVSTISVHATNVYRKRGVHTQVGLLLAYLERKGIFVFGDESESQDSNGCVPLGVTS
jgi:DNA-binding CsgD family transcriptional regulator